MITIKSTSEIEKMRKSGIIAKSVLDKALRMCVPGVSTYEVDKYINDQILSFSATPWFKEIKHYQYASCISINETWLHGVPGDYNLKENDLVSIDVGVRYDGYCADTCWTVTAKKSNKNEPDIRSSFIHPHKEVVHFLNSGVQALIEAINEVRPNSRIGNISNKMQSVVEENGYSVIRDYVGHGIGRKPHEDPPIPCFGTKGAGIVIKKGMTFAIEVMYTMGSPDYNVMKDSWSIVTKDNKLSAMFEHTVALTESGVEILTN
jgi:methionyl aminopeptidase